MERLKVKVDSHPKIEWQAIVRRLEDVPLLVTALHNAQATFVMYVQSVSYHGTVEIVSEKLPDGLLVTARWLGSRQAAQRLHKRFPAFGCVVGGDPGARPDPLQLSPAIEDETNIMILRKTAADRGIDISDISGHGSSAKIRERIMAAEAQEKESDKCSDSDESES